MKSLQLDKEAIDAGFTLEVPFGSIITVGRKSHAESFGDRGMYGNATMHVILPFENVSSRHAEIEYSLDKCLVTDLNSTNGTTVNGQTVKRSQPLIDGDLLGFAGINIKLKLSLVDFQADCGAYVVSAPPVVIDEQLSRQIEQALRADSSMWASAQKKEYTCFTCLEKVAPVSGGCSKCRGSSRLGPELDPGKSIYHGLKILRSGLRWDRLFLEATKDHSNSSYLVEMRPLHDRDLPLRLLVAADSQMLQLKHPNIINVFGWFQYPFPGWKYEYYYVRISENIKAVNAKAILLRFGPFPWRSAVSIILEALKAIIYSLEQGYNVLADSFQTGQLWLVDVGDGKYGVKVDCHRKSIVESCYPKLMVESEHFWQQLQWRKPKESEEAVPTIIVRVASALYELITGQCPPAPDMPDAPEPPGMVLIEEPQLAALIMDCARKPQRAPKTLDELRDKLSQIYDNPKVH